MTFRFRLQRLLELREQHEQHKARDLAAARVVADRAAKAREAIAAVRADTQAHSDAAARATTRVGHLHQLGTVLASLDERLMVAGDVCRVADAGVQDAQRLLEVAARERRVLDRLKSRHESAWQHEAAQKDRVQMDEVALSQFTRRQEGTTTPRQSVPGDPSTDSTA